MFTLFVFIVVLGLLVFVHEFGHFIAAKKQKIGVEEFGFGFPPRLIGFRKVMGKWQWIFGKRDVPYSGDTVYSLNWIPVGGFVRIKGEDHVGGEASQDPENFSSRGALARFTVIAMGVIFNTLLAIFLIAGGYLVGLPQVINENLSQHAIVNDRRIEVLAVLSESPAGRAGLKAGDAILRIEGEVIPSADGFRDRVAQAEGQTLNLSLRRESKHIEIEVVTEVLAATGKPGIGIGLAEVGTVRYPWWMALPQGAFTTFYLEKATVEAFGGMLRDLVLGKAAAIEVAGPVGIAVLTGEAARQGWTQLLQFTAILSVNLAVMNALPFPALDGGRLLFIILERVRRRPVSRKIEVAFHNIGFLLLLALVFLVTVKDVSRFASPIVEWVKQLVQ